MSREERRRYESDCWYEVWRAGGDPDRINLDRVEDDYYSGLYPEESASRELRRQRPAPVEEESYDE